MLPTLIAALMVAFALRPGAQASLEAKVVKLGGGSLTKPLAHSGAAGAFLDDRADVLLTYCTGAVSIIRDAPGLVTVTIPPELTVTPTFSLVVLKDSAVTDRLVIFVMSERGQGILASYGFKPASSEP